MNNISKSIGFEQDFLELGRKLMDFDQEFLQRSLTELKNNNDNFINVERISLPLLSSTFQRYFNITKVININDYTVKVTTEKATFVSKKIKKHSNELFINQYFKKNKKNKKNFIIDIEPNLSNNEILTWLYVEGKIDISTFFEKEYDEFEKIVLSVIYVLINLHQTSIEDELPNSIEIMDTNYFIDIELNDYENLPGYQSHEFVRAYQNINVQLQHLKKLRRNSFIHGDFKFDNILLKNDNSIKIIDWEKSGLGPCEADVGNFIGSLFSNWLSYKVSIFDGNFTKILSNGNWSPQKFFKLLNTILVTYQSNSNNNSNDLDIWRFAGLFLIQRAWVVNSYIGRMNLASKMSFDSGLKMLKNPEFYNLMVLKNAL